MMPIMFADATFTWPSIVQSIIEILVSGFSAMATGIGTGVTALVNALFVDSTTGTISVFFVGVLIFAAISMSVGLSRRIFRWVETLGH